ncbi:toll/interleukin-1 receptor domain-containing protein [Micromonospora sp. SL4-19]|uniref:toll/interleukin-1 receptor domain-containing protein n=1 Tax=Micromonospora sp. SL4-19 TaxID=3399129 RepID=UPI003A4DEBA1
MSGHNGQVAVGVHPTRSDRPIDFFISYSPADERWATWLAWEFEAAAYRTLLQAWDFVAGTNFIDFMDRGSGRCAGCRWKPRSEGRPGCPAGPQAGGHRAGPGAVPLSAATSGSPRRCSPRSATGCRRPS